MFIINGTWYIITTTWYIITNTSYIITITCYSKCLLCLIIRFVLFFIYIFCIIFFTTYKLNVLLYIHQIYLEIGRRSDSEQALTRIDELKRNNKSLNDEYSESISANYLLPNSRGKNYYRLHDALQNINKH